MQARQFAFLIIAYGLPVFRAIGTNQATLAKLLVTLATDGPHHYESVAVVRTASSCHGAVLGKRDSISRSTLIRSYLTLIAVLVKGKRTNKLGLVAQCGLDQTVAAMTQGPQRTMFG